MKKVLGTSVVAVAFAMSASVCHSQHTDSVESGASTRSTSSITSILQQTRLQQKLRLATEVIIQIEQYDRAQGLPANWRTATLSELYKLSNEALSAMQGVRALNDLPAAIAKAKRIAPKALGGSTQDLTYTPITPCRYIDTRDVGGKINGVRSFDLDSNAYTTAAGKCASDPYTTFGSTLAALAVNIAIFDTSAAPGVATIAPVGASTNTALVNWYQAGPSVQASNAAIVTNDQGPTLEEIDIVTSSAVHVIVDVFGAFRANEATALECVSTFSQQTVANGANFDFEIAACPSGYTVTGAGCRTSEFTGVNWAINGLFRAASGTALGAFCSGRNMTGAPQDIQGTRQCCRIPGR